MSLDKFMSEKKKSSRKKVTLKLQKTPAFDKGNKIIREHISSLYISAYDFLEKIASNSDLRVIHKRAYLLLSILTKTIKLLDLFFANEDQNVETYFSDNDVPSEYS